MWEIGQIIRFETSKGLQPNKWKVCTSDELPRGLSKEAAKATMNVFRQMSSEIDQNLDANHYLLPIWAKKVSS